MMKILGIDTSCDETSIAIVEEQEGFTILSNVIASQVEIHREYGGVHPTLATREHEKNLTPVLGESLRKANLLEEGNSFNEIKYLQSSVLKKKITKFLKSYQVPEVDALAVTVGPGLDPCLWTGVNFTKVLAHNWNLPVIPVNHLEAHITSSFLQESPSLPALALIVSGGHTQLVLVKDIGDYELLGETRDDAAGECFDKTARLLNLGYPGGPEIEKKAEKTDIDVELPRPMINSGDYDFSFSGLKTAVLYKIQEDESQLKNEDFVKAMAYEIQEAVTEVITQKTLKAARDHQVNSIIVGGGVAANQRLREKLEGDFEIHIPSLELCTDNGAMVAVTAFFNEEKDHKKLKAQPNLRL
ncbi:MAG: tRNA (adenosine(37)-N6)-threonylcarbamoyltransferase complex transferase subunit TsaD [Candidatus Paceibacterota bacterium]